ncbi:MAG: hypothetical protein ACRDLB_09435 [Actinomycetota bacterium]
MTGSGVATWKEDERRRKNEGGRMRPRRIHSRRPRHELLTLNVLIFVVVLLLAGSVPSHAGAPAVASETVVYKVSRADPAAPTLEASITLEWESDGAHVMIAALDKRKTHNRITFGAYIEPGIDLWPRVHHHGTTGPACIPSPLCTFPLKQPTTFPIQGKDVDEAFVAAYGIEPRFEITSKGWKIEPLSSDLFQVVNDSNAESSGVRFTGNYALSRFNNATLSGGPNGSLAFASIPCNPNEGVGEAELEGGVPWPAPVASDRFFCVAPDLSFYLAGLALAESETQWRLSGDVIGSGNFYDGRLAVLSFPPRTLPVRPIPGA